MLSIIKSSSDATAIDAAKILMKLEEQNLEFDFDFGADDDDDDDDDDEEWKFA